MPSSMSKRRRRATLALLRCKQLPIVLDMVGDRVQTRFMSAVFFTTVAAFVVRQTLVSLFIYNASVQNQAVPALVAFEPPEGGPRAVVDTGTQVSPSVKVLVTDTLGNSAMGQRVALFALPEDPADVTNTIQGLAGTIMDYSLFSPKERLELPRPLPISMQLPVLRGFSSTTSQRGVASFPGLAFDTAIAGVRYGVWSLVVADDAQGPPGQNATEAETRSPGACPLGVDASGRLVALGDTLWAASASVGGTTVDAAGVKRTLWVPPAASATGRRASLADRLGVDPSDIAACVLSPSPVVLSARSSVRSVTFLVQLPPSARIGGALDPQPQAIVRDSLGLPMAGKRVLLTPRALSMAEVVFFNYFPSGLLPTPALLRGALSEPSDAFGRAKWSGLGFAAAGVGHVLLTSVCDGVLGDAPTVWLESEVARIDVLVQPSPTTAEGEPLATQPQVRLLDTSGGPVAGLRAVAALRTEAGVTTTTGAAPNSLRDLNAIERGPQDLGRTKYLAGIFSAPSDSNGVARFRNLSFTFGGQTGEYTVVFGVAGVFSEPTAPIQVASAVAKVELFDLPALPEVVHLSSGVCNWGCAGWSGAWLSGTFVSNGLPPWGAGPAGVVRRPPSLRAVDKRGRPVPGKALRVVATAVACEPLEQEAVGTEAVTHLFPNENSAVTDGGGIIAFHRTLLPGLTPSGIGELLHCISETRCKPTLRFVAARNCTYELRFTVDGVSSQPWSVRVRNLDRRRHAVAGPALPAALPHPRPAGLHPGASVPLTYDSFTGADDRCSYISVTEAPAHASVGSPMGPIRVVAHNSVGRPLRGLRVRALAVTAVGQVGIRPPNSSFLANVDYIVSLWADTNPYILAASLDTSNSVNVYPSGATILGEATTDHDGSATLSGLTVASAPAGWVALRIVMSMFEYAQAPGHVSSKLGADSICDNGGQVLISVRNSVSVTVLSTPSACALGSPCQAPLRVQVRGEDGKPLVGAQVEAELRAGPRGQGLPTNIPRDLVFSGPAAPLLLWANTFDALPSRGILQGATVTTGPTGVAEFSDLSARNGYPGEFALVASTKGSASQPITIAYPMTVARLAPARTNCSAFHPTTTAIYGLEQNENGGNNYAGSRYLGDPVSCYTTAVTCVRAPGGPPCSGHGTCQCGVCFCEANWLGSTDCSTPTLGDVPVAAVRQGSLPVLSIRKAVPGFILGTVAVRDHQERPMANYSVQAHLVRCDTGAAVKEAKVAPGSMCTPYLEHADVVSSPSDEHGVATFAYYPVFINSAAPGCYAFKFSFYTTSELNMLTNTLYDPGRGTVWSEGTSQPFMLASELLALNTTQAPSRVVGAGSVFPIQPKFVVKGDLGNTEPFPSQLNAANCKIQETGSGVRCRPMLLEGEDFAICPEPPTSATIVAYATASLRRLETGEVIRLGLPGDYSACVVLTDANMDVHEEGGRRLLRAELSFTALQVPASVPVARLTQRSFDERPFPEGSYELLIEISGVLLRTGAIVQVSSSVYSMHVDDGTQALFPTAVALSQRLPLWNVTASVAPGVIVSGIPVTSDLLALDPAAPLWKHLGNSIDGTPDDATLHSLATRLADAATAAERRRKVERASALFGAGIPPGQEAPDVRLMTALDADIFRSLSFLADATQASLSISDGREMSTVTSPAGVATMGDAPVAYGRTGVYLIRITSPLASNLGPGAASSLMDQADLGAAASLLRPAATSDVSAGLSTPTALGSVPVGAPSSCEAAQALDGAKAAATKTAAQLSVLSAVTGNTTIFLPLAIRNPVDRFEVAASPEWPPDLKAAALETARKLSSRGGADLFANPALAVTEETANVFARVCARDLAGQPLPHLSLTAHIDRPIRSARLGVEYAPLSNVEVRGGLPPSRVVVTDDAGCVVVNTLRLKLAGSASEQVGLRFEYNGVYSSAVNVTLLTFADANPWSVEGLTAALFFPAVIVAPLMVANTLFSDRPAARLASAAAGMASVAFLTYVGITTFYVQQQQLQRFFEPRFVRYVTVIDWGFASFCITSCLFIVGVVGAHFVSPIFAPCGRRCQEACRRRRDRRSRRPVPPWLSSPAAVPQLARVDAWRSVASADLVEFFGFAPAPSLWRGPQFVATKASAFSRYAAQVAPRTHAVLMQKDGRLSLAAIDVLHDIFDRFVAAGRATELVDLLQAAAVDALASAGYAPLTGAAVRGSEPDADVAAGPAPAAQPAVAVGGMVTSPLASRLAPTAIPAPAGRGHLNATAAQIARLGASDAAAGRLLLALESEGYARLASGGMSRAEFVEWFAARLRLGAVWPRPPQDAMRFVDAVREESKRLQALWCTLRGSKLGAAARRVLLASRGTVFFRDRVVWAQLRALGYDARLRCQCAVLAPQAAGTARSVAEAERLERQCIDAHRLWRPCEWRLTPAGQDALTEAMRAWVGLAARDAFPGLDYAATKSFFRRAGIREPEYRMFLHACSLVEEGSAGGQAAQPTGRLQPHHLLACVAQRCPQSAAEELGVLLQAHGFNDQLIRGPSRRPRPPFFFPQRMLIGALLSAMALSLAMLWTDSLALRLTMLVDELWVEVLQFRDVAAAMATELVREQVEAVQARAFRSVVGAEGSPASNAVEAAMSSAAAQQYAARSQGSMEPGVVESAVDSAGTKVGELVYLYVGPVLDKTEPVKEAFKAKFHDAATAAAFASASIMVLCWVLMFTTFRQRVLSARRGAYTMQWRKNSLSKAVNYSGLMMSLTGLGYLLSWAPLTAIIFLFMWEQARETMLHLVTSTLASLIGVSFTITVAQLLLMKFVLVRANQIQHLRGFLLADVFFSLFQLFKGLFVALTRLIFVVAFFGLTFARSDMSQLPTEQEHLDVATSAYNAMLMMEVVYNHPLKWAFQRALINRLKAKRTLRKAVEGKARRIRTSIAGFVEKTKRTAFEMSSNPRATHQRGPRGYGRVTVGPESPPGSPLPPPPQQPPSQQQQQQQQQQHPGRPVPAVPAAAPGGTERRRSLQDRELALSDVITPRQRQIRNRWHLFLTLDRYPFLSQYRRRDGMHQYDVLWPRAVLQRDSVASAAGDMKRQREMRIFDGRLFSVAKSSGMFRHGSTLREGGPMPVTEAQRALSVKPIGRSHPQYLGSLVRRRTHESWAFLYLGARRGWLRFKDWVATREYGRVK